MFSFHQSEDALNIKIESKRLDVTNASRLREQFEEQVHMKVNKASVDLSQIEFIDSSGVGVLLGIQKKIGKGHTPIILKNPQAAVLSIIELLRLNRVFDINQDLKK